MKSLSKPPQRPPGILKVIFEKSAAGEWKIAAMQGIDLNAHPVDPPAFFRLQDDIISAQPAFLGSKSFVLGQSVVPIVAHVQGERTLRCIGTGFFISCSGLLITAAHVITDPIERQYGDVKEVSSSTWHSHDLHLGVMIPLNSLFQPSGYIFRPIEWATFLSERTDNPLPITGVNLKLRSDVAICKVQPIADGIPHQPLTIVQPGMRGTGMAVGRKALTIGYGEMKNVELSAQGDRLLAGDFSFDLHVSVGRIIEHFPDNFLKPSVPTPGPCFSASLQIPGGMSGSPIFDDEGIYVHGVVSKGWQGATGTEAFGFGSLLAHSLHIPIEQLGNLSLRELHRLDEHGFPKLRGPGI